MPPPTLAVAVRHTPSPHRYRAPFGVGPPFPLLRPPISSVGTGSGILLPRSGVAWPTLEGGWRGPFRQIRRPHHLLAPDQAVAAVKKRGDALPYAQPLEFVIEVSDNGAVLVGVASR